MSQPDLKRDYYEVLGIDDQASRAEIDRQYKRQASRHHPDRGGNEEEMKSLNEAYGILKDESARRVYDDARARPAASGSFVSAATPTAQDIGALGHCLSALLCLVAGMFLMLLVWSQWIWFLWPLAILSVLVIGFGVLMARSAMIAVNASLPESNRFRSHTKLQELAFWATVFGGGYAVYWVLAQ
jgi:curved DNA-binding protein CbpA